MWLDHLPASVAFFDVETTGVGKHDQIVSFGGIGMISRDLANGRPDLEHLYLGSILVEETAMAPNKFMASGFGSAPAGSVRSSCRRCMALPDIL